MFGYEEWVEKYNYGLNAVRCHKLTVTVWGHEFKVLWYSLGLHVAHS